LLYNDVPRFSRVEQRAFGLVHVKSFVQQMDSFEEPNAISEILTVPDSSSVPGAESVKLTDSSGFRAALAASGKAKNAEVYEWHTTKLPEHEVLSAARVKTLAVSLLGDVELYKHDARVANMTLDEFRAFLIETTPEYKEFFQKLPRMFRMIVSARNTAVNVDHIMALIQLRASQEGSSMSMAEKQLQVSRYFRSNFSREARPGEEAAAVAAGTGFRGTPMTAEQVRADLAK